MSVDLFVVRDAGDKRGDDVVDPLIGSVPVAILRGRNELDAASRLMQQVEIEAKFRTGVRLGQLARFQDYHTGRRWTGKIVGVAHAAAGVEFVTRLQVVRPIAEGG